MQTQLTLLSSIFLQHTPSQHGSSCVLFTLFDQSFLLEIQWWSNRWSAGICGTNTLYRTFLGLIFLAQFACYCESTFEVVCFPDDLHFRLSYLLSGYYHLRLTLRWVIWQRQQKHRSKECKIKTQGQFKYQLTFCVDQLEIELIVMWHQDHVSITESVTLWRRGLCGQKQCLKG